MNNQHNRGQAWNRREFVNLMATGLVVGSLNAKALNNNTMPLPKIRIKNIDSNFEREPLIPYRFKGSAITEGWQIAAYLESDSGMHKIGLGGQGILWSDSNVFAAHSPAGGNALMYAMSERALQIIKGNTFTHPQSLLDELLPDVYAYGQKITGNPDLRKTFALNALVCVDNAAWLLYAAENRINQFDDLVPDSYKPGLSFRHEKVASMPSFSVGADVEKIKSAADQGYFIMKLKTGGSRLPAGNAGKGYHISYCCA